MGFLLSFLRLRFASSLFAIRETVRRRLERVDATLDGLAPTRVVEADEGAIEEALDDDEDDQEGTTALLRYRTPEDSRWEHLQLHAMLRTLADLSGTPSKMTYLLRVLNGAGSPAQVASSRPSSSHASMTPSVISWRAYNGPLLGC